MTRRTLLSVAAAALPLAAQNSDSTSDASTLSGPLPGDITVPKWVQPKRDDKQYEICKQRGHIPLLSNIRPTPQISADGTIWPTNNYATYPRVQDKNDRTPGYVDEEAWQVCAYCHGGFRLVTKLEER